MWHQTEKEGMSVCTVRLIFAIIHISQSSGQTDRRGAVIFMKRTVGFNSRNTINQTVENCFTPLITTCDKKDDNEAGKQICQTKYETACSTKYHGNSVINNEQSHNGVAECEKIPLTLCSSARCRLEEGAKECHNISEAVFSEIPEETCDLIPQKACKGVWELTPFLSPMEKCENVPKEVCTFQKSQ